MANRHTFRTICSGASIPVDTSTGATGPSPATTGSAMQYLEGRRWVALVGRDVPLRRVQSVLGGRVVVRRCPSDRDRVRDVASRRARHERAGASRGESSSGR